MAAGAGALQVSLGGAAIYHGQLEVRPTLGEGRAPQPLDIARALALVRRGMRLWLISALVLGLLCGTLPARSAACLNTADACASRRAVGIPSPTGSTCRPASTRRAGRYRRHRPTAGAACRKTTTAGRNGRRLLRQRQPAAAGRFAGGDTVPPTLLPRAAGGHAGAALRRTPACLGTRRPQGGDSLVPTSRAR